MNKYRCPLCQEQLINENKSYRCNNGHCFDVAKEGYVNLLPVQYKHSKDPGDNKAMVDARRNFLSKGYYQPLSDKITDLCNKYTQAQSTTNILDAGCGEGFYTHQHKTPNNHVYGVDIAKSAIKIAAKKYKDCNFSVATLSKLPFEDEKFDWVYSIYAPILEEEFTRVMTNTGYFLSVTPASRHLWELKQQIYKETKLHDEDKMPIKNLSLIHQENLTYQMQFEQGADALSLLAMTPFAFKATPALLEYLAQSTNFSCQADFLIRLYKK